MRIEGTLFNLQQIQEKEHCRFTENTTLDARPSLDRPAKSDKSEAVRTLMRRSRYLKRKKLTGRFLSRWCDKNKTRIHGDFEEWKKDATAPRPAILLKKTHNCHTRAQSHTSCPSPVHRAVYEILQVLHPLTWNLFIDLLVEQRCSMFDKTLTAVVSGFCPCRTHCLAALWNGEIQYRPVKYMCKETTWRLLIFVWDNMVTCYTYINLLNVIHAILHHVLNNDWFPFCIWLGVHFAFLVYYIATSDDLALPVLCEHESSLSKQV